MKNCCSKHVDCNFCPECGDALADASPGVVILRHFRISERKARAEAESCVAHNWDRDRIAAKFRIAEKWKRWADWVEEKIKGDK